MNTTADRPADRPADEVTAFFEWYDDRRAELLATGRTSWFIDDLIVCVDYTRTDANEEDQP